MFFLNSCFDGEKENLVYRDGREDAFEFNVSLLK